MREYQKKAVGIRDYTKQEKGLISEWKKNNKVKRLKGRELEKGQTVSARKDA